MTRSVDVREPGISPALPLRLGDVADGLETEVLVRRARMESLIERWSAAFAAKEVDGEEREAE